MKKRTRSNKRMTRLASLGMALLLFMGLGVNAFAQESGDMEFLAGAPESISEESSSASSSAPEGGNESEIGSFSSSDPTPSSAITEEPDATAPAGEVVIQSFAISDDVLYQGFDVGDIDSEAGITLPGEVNATDSEGNIITIGGVTWACAAFDAAARGLYEFTATLPEGYALTAGLSAPVITVVIRDAMAVPVPVAGQTPLAVFDTLDLSGVADEQTYVLNDAMNGTQMLAVTAEFTAGAGVSERKIEIKLAEGMSFVSLPGFTKKSVGNWQFTGDSLLPNDLKGVFDATETKFVADSPIPFSNGNFQPESGTVTYYVGSNNVSLVALSIYVRLDDDYGVIGHTGREIQNAVTVTTSENTGSGAAVIETQTLESYKVTGKSGLYIYLGAASIANTYVNSGDSGTLTYSLGSKFDWSGNQMYYGVFKELTFTLRMPKEITPAATDPITIPATSNYAGMPISTYVTSDTTSNYLHVTFENFFVNSPTNARSALEFNFHFDTAPDLSEGDIFTVQSVAEECSVTPYGSDTPSTGSTELTISIANLSVVIAKSKATLTFKTPDKTQLNKGSVYIDPDTMQTGDMAWLGGYYVDNETLNDLGNQAIRIEFPDTVNVRAACLPIGSDATIHVGKLVTYGGVEIDLAGYNDKAITSVSGNYLTITLEDYEGQDGLDSTVDHIQYIEYVAGNFQQNYAVRYSSFAADSPGSFYGTFVKGEKGDIGVTVRVLPSSTLPTDWAAAGADVYPMTLKVAPTGNRLFSITGLSNNANYMAGNTYSVKAAVYLEARQYRGALGSYNQGFEIYLRDLGDLVIDESSIKVTQYDKGVPTLLTGSDIEVVPLPGRYKITTPALRAGARGSDGDTNLYFTVEYSFTVKAGAASGAHSGEELLWVRPTANTDILTVSGVDDTLDYYNNLNTYDVAGRGDTDKRYGTFDNRINFYIQAANDFQVATAAHLQMGSYDSGWVTYDDSNANTIAQTTLGANANGQLSYQVTATNNTDAIDSMFAIHVPLPREGETFNGQTFKWSAAIKSAITTSYPGIKITYSTDYVDSITGTGTFEAWDDAHKNDYKTIRIESTAAMPASTAYTFEFDLDIIGTSSEIVGWAGEANIYSSVYSISSSQVQKNDYKSEPVAMRLDTGVVMGMVFNDLDAARNGSYDSGTDTPRAGVQVVAYDSSSNIIATVYTDAAGLFSVPNLKVGDVISVKIMNPIGNADTLRFADDYATAKADKTYTNIVAGTSSDPADYNLVIGLGAPYTVTFSVAQAGTANLPSNQLVYKGGTATVPVIIPTLANYTFEKWYTAADCQTEWNFATMNITADTTIYGKLTPNPMDVTFDVATNGGQWNPLDMAAKTVTVPYNTSVGVDMPASPAKARHTFVGWSTDANATVSNFTGATTVTAHITVYAVFAPNQHTLTYVLNGGTSPASLGPDTVDYNSKIVDALNYTASPLRTNYTFDGWYTTAGFAAGTKVDATTTMPDNDLSIYAKWTETKYILSFETHGGGTNPANQPLVVGATATKPTTDPSKTGSSFVGWFTAETGGTMWNFNTDPMPANNMKLHAQYDLIPYVATFDSNSGTPVAPPTMNRYYKQLIDKPTDPTRDGYVLTGWKLTVDTSGTLAVGSMWSFASHTMPAGDITLTAQWEKRFTVTFKDHDGAVLKTQNVAPGDNATPPTSPARAGYTFAGWSGNYTNVVKNETVTATYTQNPVNLFTVIFQDWNGNVLHSETVTWGGSATPPPSPTRTGYTFAGWSGNYTNVQQNETVTAAYTPVMRFTVTFQDWNGNALRSETVARGGNATPPPNPTRTGYTFSGWSGNYTNVQRNETVTATYTTGTPDTDTDNNSTPPPVVPGATEPGNGGESTDYDPRLDEQTGNIIEDIQNGKVPLTNFVNPLVWSLLNLMMAVAGVVISVYLLTTGFRRRKLKTLDENGEERTINSDKIRMTFPRIAAIATGVLELILFLIIENIANPMVWINRWTPLFAIVFIAQIALNVLQMYRNRKIDNDNDPTTAVN